MNLMHNLLEPPAYADLFRLYPPVGFDFRQTSGGLLTFRAPFDLLTTLDSAARNRLRALPLFRLWSRKLVFPTCFVGSTITEYAPLPDTAPMGQLERLLHEEAEAPLLIIKDLPCQSPLLRPEDNQLADALTMAARQRGFMTVEGQALAYVPIDFTSLDEYLGRLSAGRRKNLRRKMKSRSLLDVDIMPLGDVRFQNQAFLTKLYDMYKEVFEQSEIHFDLLSPAFFTALLQNQDVEGVAICYRHNGELIGCNICLVHNGMLIDKYIALHYPAARALNLYFVSWMLNLEYALRHGLRVYVAGWTDPEVKAALGAQFTLTRHLVRFRNPLLRVALAPFRRCFESDGQALAALKRTP